MFDGRKASGMAFCGGSVSISIHEDPKGPNLPLPRALLDTKLKDGWRKSPGVGFGRVGIPRCAKGQWTMGGTCRRIGG